MKKRDEMKKETWRAEVTGLQARWPQAQGDTGRLKLAPEW